MERAIGHDDSADAERALGWLPERPFHPIPGLTEGGEDDAEVALTLAGLQAADLEGVTIGFIYRGSDGGTSSRRVVCRTLLQKSGVVYIQAHCLLRNAPRSFRMDRIEALFSYSTGEVIEDVDGFFAPFMKRPSDLASSRDIASFDAIEHGLKVLMFLAMADGSVHPRERDIIYSYAAERLQQLGATLSHRYLAARLENYVPTRGQALTGMRKVLDADLADARLLAFAIADVIAADGEVSDDEMVAAKALLGTIERRERRTLGS